MKIIKEIGETHIIDLVYNERIKAKRVRLVENEKMVGEMPTIDALKRARNLDLDLVVVAEGEIPVCRILDASHFKYEKKKAEKEIAKKNRELKIETKEIQLRPVTDDNDLTIKARKAKEFLENGDKVKIIIKFRGREKQHKELGKNILTKFLTLVGEHKLDKPMIFDQDDISAVISSLVSKADLRKTKCQEQTKLLETS